MQEFVDLLNGWVWSPALIYLCLGVGLYFSLRTRFLQVRHFGRMLRLLMEGKSSEDGVSSFQALAMSLAGRVVRAILRGWRRPLPSAAPVPCFGCGRWRF